MAHFALIDNTNTVRWVVVVADEDVQDAEGVEDEAVGIAFLEDLLGDHEQVTSIDGPYWKQTSYNTNAGEHSGGGTPFRGNTAGIGSTYDPENESFWGPSQFPSWVKNYSTYRWEAPIPDPSNPDPTQQPQYWWDEDSQVWVEYSEYK